MSEQKWWERYWAQITAAVSAALVIGGFVGSALHAQAHQNDPAPNVEALKTQIANMQRELTEFKTDTKDDFQEVKDQAKENTQRLFNLIASDD